MSKPIFAQDDSGHSDLSAIFEDDGRVAYAYLVRDQRVVADVWVYNRCRTPEKPEWAGDKRPPFANSAEYVDPEITLELPESPVDIGFRWQALGNGASEVQILLRGEHVASLAENERPGRSLLARRNGPAASVLRTAPTS